MASAALSTIAGTKQKTIAEEYGGKQSNQFVSEMKASTLFTFDWGELLSAAPTALSLIGSCWIAAATPTASEIVMTKSVPTGGFKYITNREEPTLRSILADVCGSGGRDAFRLASRNMDALRISSKDITTQRITAIFQRLPPATKGPRELENFNDALEDFAKEARKAAQLATETREAFTKWGCMVQELRIATEQHEGHTSAERAATRVAENVSKIEEKFAVDAVTTAKETVATVKTHLDKAEKRLDTALDNVPTPWETVIQGAVTGFTQAIPHIIAGALPMMMAASNPVGAAAMAATSVATGGAKGSNVNGSAANGQSSPTAAATAAAQQGLAVAERANDPAYVAAGEIRDLVTHFYEFLGGEKGTIDWTKFQEPKAESTTPSGSSYLIANLNGRKKQIETTGTEANTKLLTTIDGLVLVAQEISAEMKAQTELSAEKVPETKIQGWKASVKQAKADILQLAASAPTQGGSNVPSLAGKVNITVPKTDLSAQNAQLSSAMQGVQIAQNAVDLAQSSYDAAIKKQAETAKAMEEISKRLKSLQEKGKTLDHIKAVLKDCIAVLVDLVIQIGKIEKFFTMLTTVIDHVVMPTAERFKRDMSKVGRWANQDKYINVDSVTKETIYVSTLQLKSYFSLLEDISGMYSEIDKEYILPGMDLCDQLSKGEASNVPMVTLSQQLAKFTQDSVLKVKELGNKRKEEMLRDLRDRADRAARDSLAIENTVRENPALTVDESAKSAIEQGGAQAKQDTETMVAGNKSATQLAEEEMDANNL